MRAFWRPFFLSLMLIASSGCEVLLALAQDAAKRPVPVMPVLTYQDAALVASPSQVQMEAYYCPRVVPDPFGIPGSAGALCTGFFGASPATKQMQVAFQLNYKVNNPNQFPIPVTEMLTAVTTFPGATNQRLGAVCTVLCAPGDTTCTGAPTATSCQDSNRDIRSVDDFKESAADFVIAAGIQAAMGEKPSFKMPEVSAATEIPLAPIFSFGPDPLLETLKQLATQSVNQLAAGQEVTFEIPYRVEGTVWLNVGSLGRVATQYGPIEGKWKVPAQALATDLLQP